MNDQKDPSDKFVIYFAGGTMRGAFGAGVAAAFERHNIYPKVEAVYTASAGVLIGAYFLARQAQLGSSIYWEDLNKNFISSKDFLVGAWQRFQDEFIKSVPQNKLRDALDVDYLMSIVKEKKSLDIQTIFSQQIPLYVKLIELETHGIRYIDACRSDILEILKAGVNAFPYVHKISVIDGIQYIDGAILDIIGLDSLLKLHPNSKIIIILNSPVRRKLRYKIKNMFEGKFMSWMFDDPTLYRLYATAEDRLKRDLKSIQNNSQITLITPPNNFKVLSRTTNPKVLKAAWQLGLETGNKAAGSLFP